MLKISKYILLLLAILLPRVIFAQDIYLSPGETRKLSFARKIDTVFVNDPSVANYKILNDKTLLFYGIGEGKTSVDVLDDHDKSLFSATILVNKLGDIAGGPQGTIQIPNSRLKVKKVGKAYVIEGTARNEEELAQAKHLVAVATGSQLEKTDVSIKGGSSGSDNELGKDFLSKYESQDIISNAKVEKNRMINVHLTVVEVDRDFINDLGISWTNLGSNILTSNTFKGQLSFNGKGTILNFSAGNLSGFIKAINNTDYGKTLAEPNMSMLSGETAHVLIGGEYPFSQVDSNGNVSTQFKPFGIELNVGAKVQPNGKIRIALSQKVSDISAIASNGNPAIVTTESSSVFEIANGESFIIGGLYSKKRSEGLYKVPFLGELPILGAFFRSVQTSDKEKELIIVATANLVKTVQKRDIKFPNFKDTSTLERFFNTTPITDKNNKKETSEFLQRGGFIQ